MAVKIAAFFLTLLINVVTGIAIFFFMLLAMNGFSESDAEYGLGAYIVLAAVVSLGMSTGAAFTAHLLFGRKFRGAVACSIAIVIFSLVGAALKIVCSIVGVLMADYVRVNY